MPWHGNKIVHVSDTDYMIGVTSYQQTDTGGQSYYKTNREKIMKKIENEPFFQYMVMGKRNILNKKHTAKLGNWG